MMRAKGLWLLVAVVLASSLGAAASPALAQSSWQEQQYNWLRKALSPNRSLGNPLRKAAPETLWYTILLREQTGTRITVRYEKVLGVDAAAQIILTFMTEPATGMRGFYVQCFLTGLEAEYCLNIHKADAYALGAKFQSLPGYPR